MFNFFPYPCPIDKTGTPIYPGDEIVTNENTYTVIGIASPMQVLCVEDIDERSSVIVIDAKDAVAKARRTANIVEAAYELGKSSKKNKKKLDRQRLEHLTGEYMRDVSMAAAQITERQELANSELLKLLKDTQDELDEIKSMLPQEQEPLSEDIIDVDA